MAQLVSSSIAIASALVRVGAEKPFEAEGLPLSQDRCIPHGYLEMLFVSQVGMDWRSFTMCLRGSSQRL